jgi:PAS domain S-box-containing protein
VIGKQLYDFIEKEHIENMKTHLNQVFKTGKSISYEIPGYGPDGTVSWYSSKLGPIYQDKNIVGATLITRDITKRKQVESELKQHQDKLEDIVKTRTRELTKLNEQLQSEIIERKIAEEELRNNEEKYRFLFENISDVIFIFDSNLNLTSITPTVEKMSGYKPDEIVGKSFADLDFLTKESMGRLFENAERIFSGEDIGYQEYDFLAKDGTIHATEVSYTPIYHNEEFSEFVCVARDITERKQAQKAIQESEEKFRSLAEQSPNMIFINKKGKIVYVNEQCVTNMGYSREEYYSPDFDFMELIAPDSKEFVKEIFEKHKKGEDVPEYEYSLIRRDGTKIDALNTTRIINYEGELAILGVVTDITSRKLAEERLRESVEMYETLVKTSPEAVTLTDLEGNIIFVSPRTLELHGYSDENELLGRNAFEMIAPEDREIAMKNLQKTLKQGNMRNLEYKLYRKDGSTFIGGLSAALIKDAHGNPKSFIATIRDISEQKKAEEKIKDALEEKEVMLREIHHRVKNNIQVITSMINLHTSYIQEERYVETFQEIQNRIKTMALIHQKLYQSKDLAKIDFNEYITDLVKDLFRFYDIKITKIKPVISVKDVELDIDIGIPCGLIINELVSNSMKHAFPNEKKGEIHITLKPADRNNIVMIVSDNGIGFPEELDFKNTKTFGLQLVNALVEQLGGNIELKSSDGTEFIITFEIELEEEKVKKESKTASEVY